jgi:hypothetical protein
LNFSIESIGSASVDFSVDSGSSSEEEQITDEDEEVDVYQSIPVDLNNLIFADSWCGADNQVDTDGVSEYSTEGNSPLHSPIHSGTGASERIEDFIALAAGTRMSSASQKAAALRMRLQGHTMEAFIGAHSKCDSNLTRTATRLIEKGYSPLEVTAAIAATDEAAPIDLEMLHRAVSSDASTGAECLPSSSASPRQEQFKTRAMDPTSDPKYRLLPSGTFGRTALQTIGGMFHHFDRRKCGRWDGDDFGRFLQQVASCGPSWRLMSCVTDYTSCVRDDTSLPSCVKGYTSLSSCVTDYTLLSSSVRRSRGPRGSLGCRWKNGSVPPARSGSVRAAGASGHAAGASAGVAPGAPGQASATDRCIYPLGRAVAPMFLEAAISLPLLAVHPSNFGHRLPTAGEGRVQTHSTAGEGRVQHTVLMHFTLLVDTVRIPLHCTVDSSSHAYCSPSACLCLL